MKRGELWTASGGASYTGKPRPVLIVQDDHFAGTASITICPLTSHAVDADLFRPAIAPNDENGLRESSFAMVDKIATVPRTRLGKRVGIVRATQMAPVNQAMLIFLGLAGVRD